MLWLREVLAAHWLLVALLHGQAFFVLGLSIVFLARRSSRLEIVRGLTPLAVFGFCEAVAAWNPIWAAASSFVSADALVPWSAWSRLLLLGAGYAFLLAFALQAYTLPEERWWEQLAFAGVPLALWLIGLIVARWLGASQEQVWLGGEITARYLLALPGGLIGAWGLRRQTYRTIRREQLPLVKPYLRFTGLGLISFALVGGLIGPAAPFLSRLFPANLLNEDVLLQATGVPVSVLRGLCGALITYGVVRALGMVLSDIDLWLESVERSQALARERERIGRELHDGTIQSIYAAGLMLEGARHSIRADPEGARVQLTRAIESLNQTIQDIRRYIFDLRGEMPADDLETGLKKIIRDFRVNTLLETDFAVVGEDPRTLRAEHRQHIFQIAREALTNVARHARARRVKVRLQYGVGALQLTISDDGVGLSVLPIDKGQGLQNIRERTRLLDGMLDIETAPDEGMTLTLIVPY